MQGHCGGVDGNLDSEAGGLADEETLCLLAFM